MVFGVVGSREGERRAPSLMLTAHTHHTHKQHPRPAKAPSQSGSELETIALVTASADGGEGGGDE